MEEFTDHQNQPACGTEKGTAMGIWAIRAAKAGELLEVLHGSTWV